MERLRYGYIVLVALIPLAALYAVMVARPASAIEIMAGMLVICAIALCFGLRLADRVHLAEDAVHVRTPFADYRFPWSRVTSVSAQGPKSFLHVEGSILPFAINRQDYEALSQRLDSPRR